MDDQGVKQRAKRKLKVAAGGPRPACVGKLRDEKARHEQRYSRKQRNDGTEHSCKLTGRDDGCRWMVSVA